MRADVGERVLSSAALSRLVAQSWPGNVRELGAVLYRAAASAEHEIAARHVDEASRQAPHARRPVQDARALLELCEGNVSRAARTAGVPRSTFRAWLAQGPSRAARRERSPKTGWPKSCPRAVKPVCARADARHERDPPLGDAALRWS